MARRGGKNKTGRKHGGGVDLKSGNSKVRDDVVVALSRSSTSRSSSSLVAAKKKNPLIAFFGQLSFDTSREDLMEHIHTQLKHTRHKVSDRTLKIRMLTDPTTKTLRGMAFVQVNDEEDPEFLYALLKLHQTYLKGRRINVERSAGGRKNSESRKAKLELFKGEQEAYFVKVVDNIMQEFQARGEIRKDELDDGVITMCRHHSGPVVRAAITEYVEKGGRDMDNPSAYLTFLVAKFAKEGIRDEEVTGKSNKKTSVKGRGEDSRKRKSHSSNRNENDKKRIKEWTNSSDLAQSGVDMSISDTTTSHGKSSDGIPTKHLSKSFPFSQRGRGRGYMRTVR
jgi:RNA recognition motif-containing protein